MIRGKVMKSRVEGTKIFGGKRYEFYAPAKTKTEAQREANIQRKQGF